MDYRTCDAMKKYNALRHMTIQKEERIEEVKKSYQELLQAITDSQATAAGTNKEGKRLRELENRLDKAHLKHQEAEHIRRTYLQIKDKLQEVSNDSLLFCVLGRTHVWPQFECFGKTNQACQRRAYGTASDV